MEQGERRVIFPLTGRIPVLAEYAISVVLILVAVGIRMLLDPFVGDRVPFLAVFVVLMPLVIMVRPGAFLFAALFGLTLVWFLVLPPRSDFDLTDPAVITQLVGSLLLALAAFFATWMLSQFRKRDLRAANEIRLLNEHLEERVRERTQELKETNDKLVAETETRLLVEEQRTAILRRLINSQETERQRIGLDIHDHLGQRLTAFRLQLESLKNASTNGSGQVPLDSVQALDEHARILDAEVSYLAWELRPTVLDQFGLVETLRVFIQEWSKQFGISAEFRPSDLGRTTIDKENETHLYRITQEALNNIAKHSNARLVSVQLGRHKDLLSLIIEDDGSGFEMNGNPDSDSLRGMGLLGMKERAELIGGEFQIESEPGEGTTVFVRVPERTSGAATA